MNRALPVITLSLLLAACMPAAPVDTTNSSSSVASLSSVMAVSSASSVQADVELTSHQAGDTVASPLILSGRARGPWYFEASFPVEIRNAQNTIIAQHYAEAQSDWMTTDWVSFQATLTFPTQPAGSTGSIILRKDNPSGEPQNDASVTVPVVF